MTYIPLEEGDIPLGEPLPWTVYGPDGAPLFVRGERIDDPAALPGLFARGLYRDAPRHARSRGEGADASGAPRERLCALDQVRLQIGDELQLQPQIEGGVGRHSVRLIGYLRGRSVLVTTPMVDGKVLLIRDGQSYVVRLFSGRSVFAFTTTVLKSANVPFPHLHLAYPNQVSGLCVRQGARAEANVIVAATDARGVPHAGTLSNISTGGAKLVARRAVGAAGDRLTLKGRVFVDGAEHYLELAAIVRSARTETDVTGMADMVGHGLQFVDVAEQDHLVLSAFVYQQLVQQASGL